MRFIFRGRVTRAALVTSIALLAACDDSPTQPSQSSAVRPLAVSAEKKTTGEFDQYFTDLTDRNISLGCEDGSTSEDVLLRGGIIERYKYVQLPSGTVITRHDSKPEGLWGLGAQSGQEYDVELRVQAHDAYADRGIMGHSREVWELRNRTTKALYHLTYAVRYVMDADRNLVVHRWRERVACR